MTTHFKPSILILALFIVGFVMETGAKQTYNILFVQSYTEHDTWARELNEGLKKEFKKQSVSVNITTEYLNSRCWRAGEQEIMSRICKRAQERGTDLIITSNDEALYALLTCGDSLPANVPVIYSSVQFPNYKLLRTFHNVTGTTAPFAYDKLLNAVKDIFPDRKKVVVLSEETTLGGRWGLQAFKESWRNFLSENSGYSIKEFNVTSDPLADIINEVQLSEDISNSVVVIPYWGLFMPSITKVSKAPTFSTSASALMAGGFCAAAPSPNDEVREIVGRAVKILNGAEPASLGVTEGVSRLTYDYKQLDFFDVEKDRIPENGTIINEPYIIKCGFWYIFLYAVILGLLVLLVVRLIATNRRESVRRLHVQSKLLLQERMIAQRNEFDNVLHSIQDGVVTYDMDHRILFVNRTTLQAFGLQLPTDAELRPYGGQQAGSLCALLHHGENILSDLLKKVATEGVSVTIPEDTFLQAIYNKKSFPVSGEIVPLYAKGKQTGMVLSFRNVSNEALQKRYYNMAVVESLIYPWQYSRAEDSFSFPTEYSTQMGFEDNIVKRSYINSKLHPEDMEETSRLFSAVIEGRAQNVRLTFRQRNAMNSYEWWEFRITTIEGATDGVPGEVIGVCQSIQRFKSTEEELVAARDRALQADKLKSAFLANMSHEIRTPLNAIVGFSDLLKDYQMFSEEEMRQFIATINKNCELLLALISDILDLSRVESGTMDFQFSSYFLPIVMQEIYDSQRLNMPPDVELVKAIPEGSEKNIITDSVRLKQILNNLINNAAKFTTSGSITFGYEEEPGYTSFFVEDTGIGLSAEDKKRIFERFYKADNFTQGTGLGLSIAQTIVSKLNGTITVESEKKKGTRFTVKIPDRES